MINMPILMKPLRVCRRRLPTGSYTARKKFFSKQTAQLSSTALLTDLVDSWCHETSLQMGLHKPERYIQLQAAAAHVSKQELLRKREAKEQRAAEAKERQRLAEAALQLRKLHPEEGFEERSEESDGEEMVDDALASEEEQDVPLLLQGALSAISGEISDEQTEVPLHDERGGSTPIGVQPENSSPQLMDTAAGDKGGEYIGAVGVAAAAADGLVAATEQPESKSSGRDAWIVQLATRLKSELQVRSLPMDDRT